MTSELGRGVALIRSDRSAETVAGIVLVGVVVVPVLVELVRSYRQAKNS